MEKKKNKLEASSSQKEFEYDWDEDESMSYLKKFNNENLKENYNKYGAKPKPAQPPMKTIRESEEKVRRKSKHKKSSRGHSKKRMKTERVKERHFKSVAPKFIDDWDE